MVYKTNTLFYFEISRIIIIKDECVWNRNISLYKWVYTPEYISITQGWHLSKVKATKEILFFVNEVKILTLIIILEYFKEDGTNFWTMTSQKVLELRSHFVKTLYVTSHYICIKYCINQVCITWLRAVLIWMRTTSTTFRDSVLYTQSKESLLTYF